MLRLITAALGVFLLFIPSQIKADSCSEFLGTWLRVSEKPMRDMPDIVTISLIRDGNKILITYRFYDEHEPVQEVLNLDGTTETEFEPRRIFGNLLAANINVKTLFVKKNWMKIKKSQVFSTSAPAAIRFNNFTYILEPNGTLKLNVRGLGFGFLNPRHWFTWKTRTYRRAGVK